MPLKNAPPVDDVAIMAWMVNADDARVAGWLAPLILATRRDRWERLIDELTETIESVEGDALKLMTATTAVSG